MSFAARTVLPPTFLAALVLILAGGAAHAFEDPPPPAGGFTVRWVRNQLVTFGDGATTRVDLRFPDDSIHPPPAGGWPVVILVHGLAGSRFSISSHSKRLAANGYFALAYDVRGQGDAYAFPSTFVGQAEKLDLAELVLWAEAGFGALADTSRLGIQGPSQGGGMTWGAVALSGRALPPNDRGLSVFPVFSAAVPWMAAPASPEVFAPGAKSVLLDMVSYFWQRAYPPTLQWDPDFYDEVTSAILAEDFARLAAIWELDFWRQDLPHCADSSVPVLVLHSWNDTFMASNLPLEAIAALPATTPARAFSSTIGHDEGISLQQRSLAEILTERWFDRFLKGEDNQVELEPRVLTCVVPPELATQLDPFALRWNRFLEGWPPASTVERRFWLRDGGALDPDGPGDGDAPVVIRHDVDPDASMAALFAGGGGEPLIEGWIPLSASTWDSPPLEEGTEIAGRARVTLEVTPSGADYQLHAVLAQVTPDGGERFLQAGLLLVQGDGTPATRTIDLIDIDALLNAGDRIRLRVQNLTREVFTEDGVTVWHRVAPYFDSVDVTIEQDSARPSFIDLPIESRIAPALSLPEAEVDTLAPVDLTFALEGPARFAGADYFVAFGISGLTPGFVLPGGDVALLNLDFVTTNLLQELNSALYPATLGVLDGAARADPPPQVLLSQVPDLDQCVGLRLIALAFVRSPSEGFVPTNPVECTFK